MLKNIINIEFLKYNLKKNMLYFLIFGLLLFAVFPLPVIIDMVNTPRSAANLGMHYTPSVSGYNYAFTSMMIILTILTPFILFNYLTSKKSVDVFHALPVKRKELFLSTVLTGIALVVIPGTINYLLGHGIFYLHHGANDAALLYDWFVIMFFAIAIQSISTFVILNTGTLIDSLIHTGILIFLPFGIFFVIVMFTNEFLFGLGGITDSLLKVMTPLYAIYHALFEGPYQIQLLIYWFALYAIFLMVQTNIYIKRKSERSEEPFTNKYYFPIITAVFTGLIFIMLNAGYSALRVRSGMSFQSFFAFDSILLALIITFVGYTILNIFKNRSTKYFLTTIKNYVIIVLVATILSVTTIQTQAFGLVWRVPNASKIESIELYDNALYQVHPILSLSENTYNSNNVKIKDEAIIDMFTKVHKSINQKVKRENNFLRTGDVSGLLTNKYACTFEETIYLDFTYHLKNGQKIPYSIKVPRELLLEFTALLDVPNYHAFINPILNEQIKIKSLTIYNDLMDLELLNGYQAKGKEIQENLIHFYNQDLENLDSDTLVKEKSTLKYMITYEFDLNIDSSIVANKRQDDQIARGILMVDDRFEKTLAYIESFNVNPIKTDDVVYRTEIEDSSYIKNCGAISFFSYGYYPGDHGLSEESSELNHSEVESFRNNLSGSHIGSQRARYLIINEVVRIPISTP